jgi:hypothetical protein
MDDWQEKLKRWFYRNDWTIGIAVILIFFIAAISLN